MQGYKTIMEKSSEWNLSARHVQHLCRKGEVDGAVKRAGSWFIPSDTPSPAKNSKWNTGEFNFAGTKKEIFNCAIDLFTERGFDSVSLRDIASQVGIQQSTIYNHFKSKQEILDAIYNFYCYYHLHDRPTTKEMDALLKGESVVGIINHMRYLFNEDYRQKLLNITRIIFQRISIDDRARDIAKSLMMDEGVRYVEEIFNRGVKSGRFAPFNTHVMAVFVCSMRIFTLYYWLLDASLEVMTDLVEVENAMYELAAGLIVDLSRKDNHK